MIYREREKSVFIGHGCKQNPKPAPPGHSLLPEQVQHGGLQVVSEGADGGHQPVGVEAGVGVHHALGHVHLRWRGGHTVRHHRAGRGSHNIKVDNCDQLRTHLLDITLVWLVLACI